ncbi:peptide ABC transporter substrate-binding protein [Streptomyces tubbatahanensis]|uniref:Peptide ABC transporter substrate-binding protein n=1 Tax=Streptomyces tubbatahanensis TaxID=2923272 RepID=A0ABY3XXD9_9ACTN|nr:peptide ABC transporter substrate-binding protein [Streptomyces tubbatahanensis]UNS99181.1 peptide ABC transporter substrate-binding protein [Streptomyces tubbatahanensis]
MRQSRTRTRVRARIPRRRGRLLASVALLATTALLAGCGPKVEAVTDVRPGQGTPVEGGTAVMALPPAATPNWIFPIGAPGYLATYNSAIQNLLYPPLYTPEPDKSGKLTMDSPRNVAEKPRFSDGNRTVTVTLKKRYRWSDGEPVTADDVRFWFELIRANKDDWGGYSPKLLPDNVETFQVLDDHTFRLRLDRAYNPAWFTADQLEYFKPLPRHAWSKKGEDPKKVFKRLLSHAKQLSKFDSDPLWKTTMGPWRIEKWTASGHVSLVPNKRYGGPDKPHLDRVVLKPFTTASSEFNVLRAGGLDYGYIPPSVMAQSAHFKETGYRIDPWESWGITYLVPNLNHPETGPLMRQRYLRRALQSLIDQKAISEHVWHGSAEPTLGPVPSALMEENALPYDPGKARSLLAAHGWKRGEDGGGTLRCAAPGTGEGHCGKGIDKGQELALELLSQSGSTETSNTMQAIKSSFSRAGVRLDIREQPLNTVLGTTVPCKPKEVVCSQWQLGFFGTQGSWIFPAEPSGQQLFATGAPSNMGNWSDAKTDELIKRTEYSDDDSAMRDYARHLAREAPVLWTPNPAYQVSVIRSDLRGIDQNPTLTLAPQDWYFVKKPARGGKGADR